jgi:hypothetical protein
MKVPSRWTARSCGDHKPEGSNIPRPSLKVWEKGGRRMMSCRLDPRLKTREERRRENIIQTERRYKGTWNEAVSLNHPTGSRNKRDRTPKTKTKHFSPLWSIRVGSTNFSPTNAGVSLEDSVTRWFPILRTTSEGGSASLSWPSMGCLRGIWNGDTRGGAPLPSALGVVKGCNGK